jgi:hypothetical protein
MRVTVISCCRCKSPISGGRSIITFEAGELSRTRDDPIDLCSDCCAEFVDWLYNQEQDDQSDQCGRAKPILKPSHD